MLERLFQRWDSPSSLRPRTGSGGVAGDDALSIRWLGTAGHALRFRGKTLLLDPFVSRPGLTRLFRPLRTDPRALARWAPAADLIAVGHAHFDHLLDAPEIARRTGAVFVGSRSAARVALARGVSRERIRAASPAGLVTREGPFTVRMVPSRHAKLILGLTPPFPGEVRARRPTWVHEFRAGLPCGVFVETEGVTVYHNGSADLVDAALEGLKADVLLLGIAGWGWTPRYLERLIHLLEPRVIVPTHYDAFFFPLEEGVRLLPGLHLERFLETARRLAPDAVVVAPTPFEELLVSEGGRRLTVRAL